MTTKPHPPCSTNDWNATATNIPVCSRLIVGENVVFVGEIRHSGSGQCLGFDGESGTSIKGLAVSVNDL